MLKIKIDIGNQKALEEHINYVNKMLKMKTDKSFQTYIQEKCLNTVKSVARQRLGIITTTNEDLKDLYIENNKIRDIKNGFEIYNDLSIEKPDTHHSKGYKFSLALAFEYGTGIIGQGSVEAPSNYQYNVNNNKVIIDGKEIDGWWISKDKNGSNPYVAESKSGKAVVTQGYEGAEIYRYSAIEIKKRLKSWVNSYFVERGDK